MEADDLTHLTKSWKMPWQQSGHMLHLMMYSIQTGLLRVVLIMEAAPWWKPQVTLGILTSWLTEAKLAPDMRRLSRQAYALELCVSLLAERQSRGSYLVCSDSQSALAALKGVS